MSPMSWHLVGFKDWDLSISCDSLLLSFDSMMYIWFGLEPLVAYSWPSWLRIEISRWYLPVLQHIIIFFGSNKFPQQSLPLGCLRSGMLLTWVAICGVVQQSSPFFWAMFQKHLLKTKGTDLDLHFLQLLDLLILLFQLLLHLILPLCIPKLESILLSKPLLARPSFRHNSFFGSLLSLYFLLCVTHNCWQVNLLHSLVVIRTAQAILNFDNIIFDPPASLLDPIERTQSLCSSFLLLVALLSCFISTEFAW